VKTKLILKKGDWRREIRLKLALAPFSFSTTMQWNTRGKKSNQTNIQRIHSLDFTISNNSCKSQTALFVPNTTAGPSKTKQALSAKLWITTPKALINILYSYLIADVLEADISRLLGAVAVRGSFKTRELTDIFKRKTKILTVALCSDFRTLQRTRHKLSDRLLLLVSA